MLFVCHPQILHKHCLQFLLGVKMAPRETENNAYAKFWGDKQRALWYVVVFLEWSIDTKCDFLFAMNGLCTFSLLFWQKIDERDCYLAGKPSYCSVNSFWRVFVFVSTFPLERFTPKVAFSPNGAVLSLNSLVWFSWMISLNRASCHRQIWCLKVVLPQAKYVWGPKL